MSNSGKPTALGSLTSEEVAADEPSTLLIPLGATEQHGPHLPLDTDTVVATRWAERVAELLRGSGHRAVVAPPLPYGSSGEHQMFPGTLSIGHDALRMVLIELTRSAAEAFEFIVFLSGHAGNLEPVTAAVEQLRVEGHRTMHFFPAWVPGGPTIDAHAGQTETSLMLHLQPTSVRSTRVATGDTRPLSEVIAVLTSDGVAAVSPSGVLGDPTLADAQQGAALLDTLVERTASEISSKMAEPGPQYDTDGID